MPKTKWDSAEEPTINKYISLISRNTKKSYKVPIYL